MKKIMFLLLFIIGSFALAFESHSLEFKKEIYEMITQIEEYPESPENNAKWQKILRFAIEDEEATVYLIGGILGDEKTDKFDDDTRSALVMSYTMGALKDQLISDKEITQEESTQNGLKAAVKTYKRLKKSKGINIKFYELLIEYDTYDISILQKMEFEKLLNDSRK